MKKCFSWRLFVEGLKQIRSVGIACSVVIVALIITPIAVLGVEYISSKPEIIDEPYPVTEPLAMIGAYAILFLAPVVVMRMFSFLNKRSSSDFFHSIPQKRICLFFSFTAGVVAWILFTTILCGIISYVGWNIIPVYRISIAAVLRCIFSYIILGLLSASCALLAVSITGNVASGLFAWISTLCVPAFVVNLFGYLIQNVEPSFVIEKSIFQYTGKKGFLPLAWFELLTNTEETSVFFSPTGLPIILAIIASAALIAIAAVCFVKRKSETAEHGASSKVMQHVLRCAASLPVWLLITWIFRFSIEAALSLIPFSFALYIVYELITTKKLKNLLWALPVYLILPIICLELLFGAYIGKLVLHISSPDNVEQVSYIVLSDDDGIYLDSYSNLPIKRLVGEKLDDPDVINSITNNLKYNDSLDNNSFTVMLKLKNGKTLYRNCCFYSDNSTELVTAFMNNGDCKKLLLTLDDKKPLSIDIPKRIYDIFLQEYNALSDEDKLLVYRSSDKDKEPSIIVFEVYDNESTYKSLVLDESKFPKTFKQYSEWEGKNWE